MGLSGAFDCSSILCASNVHYYHCFHLEISLFTTSKSMGVGEFLSSKATNEWILSERRREVWELENYPEGEIQEVGILGPQSSQTCSSFLHSTLLISGTDD